MGRQIIWFALLGVVVLATGWFVGKAGLRVIRYVQLNARATASVDRWEVEQVSTDDYFLRATYRYVVDGVEHHGESRLAGKHFRNEVAAQLGIRDLQGKGVSVWYAPSHPEISQLERRFPFKTCIYSAILLILLAYLWPLSRYALQAPQEGGSS